MAEPMKPARLETVTENVTRSEVDQLNQELQDSLKRELLAIFESQKYAPQLKGLVQALADHGKTPKDLIWVGRADASKACSFAEFEAMILKNDIWFFAARSLVAVGHDFWLRPTDWSVTGVQALPVTTNTNGTGEWWQMGRNANALVWEYLAYPKWDPANPPEVFRSSDIEVPDAPPSLRAAVRDPEANPVYQDAIARARADAAQQSAEDEDRRFFDTIADITEDP